MKNLYLFLILFLSLACENKEYNHIGKWESEKEAVFSYLNFKKNGFCDLGIRGYNLIGENYSIDGKKGKLNYVIKADNREFEIDIIMTNDRSKQKAYLYGIGKFENENVMKIAFDDKERPSFFTKENSITLVKKD